MSKAVIERGKEPGRLGQEPPLTDWLIALSHDSPFEGPQTHAAQAGSAHTLAVVPGLLSL
jgi:hypothetical protein